MNCLVNKGVVYEGRVVGGRADSEFNADGNDAATEQSSEEFHDAICSMSSLTSPTGSSLSMCVTMMFP